MKIDGGQDGWWWECEEHGRSPYKCILKSEAEYLGAMHASADQLVVLASRPMNRHPSEGAS